MLKRVYPGIRFWRKRENYRIAFDNFDAKKIAEYGDKKFDELLNNAGIVRNRLKIKSAIQNANAYLKVKIEFGSFDKYIWSFVDGKPTINKWKEMSDVPAKTEISDKMAEDLKKRGFNFCRFNYLLRFYAGYGDGE